MEKSSYFGGSTARSGGGVWIPRNYALTEAKQVDAGEDARASEYLDAIVGDVVPKTRRDTYLERGPEVMDFIKATTPVRFRWVPEYADYHPEAPGGRAAGRSAEPVALDARFLGDELDRLHPQYTKPPANMIVTQADFRKISLGLRTVRGPIDTVILSSRSTRSAKPASALAGDMPCSRSVPDRSMNASSIETGSTSGVRSRMRARTSRPASAYFSMFGRTMVACGQSLRASNIGMAERMP